MIDKFFLGLGATVIVLTPAIGYASYAVAPAPKAVIFHSGVARPLGSGVRLAAYDRVITRSSGAVVSANGCMVAVPANSILQVPASGCGMPVSFTEYGAIEQETTSGQTTGSGSSTAGGTSAGGTAGGAGAGTAAGAGAAGAGGLAGLSTLTIIAGVAGLAAVAATVAAVTDDSNSPG